MQPSTAAQRVLADSGEHTLAARFSSCALAAMLCGGSKTMMEQKREQRGSHSLLDLPQTSVFAMQPGRHQLRETIPHTGAFLKLCGAYDGAGDHEKAVVS